MAKNFIYSDIEAEYAVKRGGEALDNVADTLRRALKEVEDYKRRFDDVVDLKDKADRLNWTVGYVASNILGNCRLDMVSSAAAELVRVGHVIRNEKE